MPKRKGFDLNRWIESWWQLLHHQGPTDWTAEQKSAGKSMLRDLKSGLSEPTRCIECWIPYSKASDEGGRCVHCGTMICSEPGDSVIILTETTPNEKNLYRGPKLDADKKVRIGLDHFAEIPTAEATVFGDADVALELVKYIHANLPAQSVLRVVENPGTKAARVVASADRFGVYEGEYEG